MTQQQLGNKVGIKFQQIQKYETARTVFRRPGFGILRRPWTFRLSFFFEGLGAEGVELAMSHGDILTDKEALDLVRAYYSIPETQRRRLFDLARVLSDAA